MHGINDIAFFLRLPHNMQVKYAINCDESFPAKSQRAGTRSVRRTTFALEALKPSGLATNNTRL
jgi:hypothetical protein